MAGLAVSVAMATHNGERFLPDQLASLASQTYPPCELVVHDDSSSDRTVDTVGRFARTAPFSVNIIRSTARRGYPSVFLEAARQCSGDYIAFCDQDDVWKPEKLERCMAEFERQGDVTLVTHSAHVLEEGTQRRSRSYPRHRRRSVTTPRSTPIMPTLPGFAMVASRLAFDARRVVSDPSRAEFAWDHDDWTMTVASALGNVVFLPEQLVLYRQHDANVWGAPALAVRERLKVSVASRGQEEEMYRWIAEWAREHVRLMEQLDRAARGTLAVPMDGPRSRARLWGRLAEVSDHRANLYAMKRRGPAAMAVLLGGLVRGDYRGRAKGGSGGSSLARDALYVSGLLGFGKGSLAQ
jgi:glycosyltransferase involved in cell wall biosynthesis